MTRVFLQKKNGFLRCRASGHAMAAQKGSDIVCAAVTILIRTSMQTLSSHPKIEFSHSAKERGHLEFFAKADFLGENDDSKKIVDFLAEYLANGFESLSKEFPNNIEFNLEE